MVKRISFVVLITLVFIASVVTFEVIHRQSSQDPPSIPAAHTQPLNITLKDDFIEELKNRTEEPISEDLIY